MQIANATLTIQIDDTITEKIPLQKGAWEGDINSTKLFTLTLETIFKKLT